jgi:hypothetical protein
MSRAPSDASRWVAQLQRWNFERVVPAHFDAPLDIGPKALDDAFAFLAKGENEARKQDFTQKCFSDTFAFLATGKNEARKQDLTQKCLSDVFALLAIGKKVMREQN